MNPNLLEVLIQQHLLPLLRELSNQPKRNLLEWYDEVQRDTDFQTTRTELNATNVSIQKLASLVVGDIRKEVFQFLEEAITVHRVFLTLTSGLKYDVGWVLSEDVSLCMICCRYFYRLTEQFAMKHHCRACGNIVCGQCSASVAFVEGLETFGEQRVCLSCNYGQSIVEAHSNRKSGISIFDHPAISSVSASTDKEELETDDDSLQKSVPDGTLDEISEADRIYQEKMDYLQSFIRPEEKIAIEKVFTRTAASINTLPVADYGPFELLAVDPYLVMKCFYTEKAEASGSIVHHQIQNSRRLFTSVQELLEDMDRCNATNTFVFVNVCTSEMVPMDSERFYFQKTKKTRVSDELYPIVFNLLADKYQGIAVIDVAVNPAYIDYEDQNKMQSFEDQLLNGLSLLFPTDQFVRCEIVTNGSPTTSQPSTTYSRASEIDVITPRNIKKRQAMKRRLTINEMVQLDEDQEEVTGDGMKENHPNNSPFASKVLEMHRNNFVRMILPAEEAMVAFRYTFTSMTSLILQTTQARFKEKVEPEILVKLSSEFTTNLVKLLSHRKEKAANYQKARFFLQELNPQQHHKSTHSTPSKAPMEFSPPTPERIKPPALKIPLLAQRSEDLMNLEIEEKHEETNVDDSNAVTTTPSVRDGRPALPRQRSSLKVPKKGLVRSPSFSSVTSSMDLSVDSSLPDLPKQSSYSPTAWELMKQSLRKSQSGMVVPKGRTSPTNSSNALKKIDLSQHLQASHFQLIEELRVDTLTADRLKERAKKDPDLLIGWQVLIYKEKEFLKGLYVITAVAFFPVIGRMFRVSQAGGRDRWMKLGLHRDSKKRFSFQLQRQVYTKQEMLALQKIQ